MNRVIIRWSPDAAATWRALDANRKEEVRRLLAHLKNYPRTGFPWGRDLDGRTLWFVSASETQLIYVVNYIRQADEVFIVSIGTHYWPPLEERD